MVSTSEFTRVSRNYPCPICGKEDWCLVAEDGSAAICPRTPDGAVKEIAGSGYLHRLSEPGRNEAGISPGNGATPQRSPVTSGSNGGRTGAPHGDAGGNGATPPGCTLEQYATHKCLPLEFLSGLGLKDQTKDGVTAVRIPYLGQDGLEGAVRYRIGLEGKDRFRWKKGSKLSLYGLWRLEDARKAGYVVIVEGESDCHTLWHHGIPAMGLPGAGNWNEDRDASVFDGIGKVYVHIEPDKGGQQVQHWLAQSKIRDRAHLLKLEAFKDPSELHKYNADAFKARFEEARKSSEAWSSAEDRDKRERRAAAWEKCKDLAMQPRILDRFEEQLRKLGVVGEAKIAKLLYLAVTSRVLDKPVSVAVKGPSSGGKSFLTENVLRCFPKDAYYSLSAMSERALAYSEEPLEHRMFVVYEAAGLNSEMAEYLVRSLLSEGHVRYETVQKTDAGHKARVIERKGPTGLVITTTALAVHPENENRLLSVTVEDTPEQTQAIMIAIASEQKEAPDLTDWLAFQDWIWYGDHRVTVPYGKCLGKKIAPKAVRLRRDFGQLLHLVKTHALLHQENRERDAEGRVVATFDDYEAVSSLVGDILAEGLEQSVKPAIRETVKAVEVLEREHEDGVSLAVLAKNLGLDKSAASRRANQARKAGFLVNKEVHRGKQARYILGDPLPEDGQLLPTRQALEAAYCAGAGGSAASAPVQPHTAPGDGAERCTVAPNQEEIPPEFLTPASASERQAWDDETSALIEWFNNAQPPVESFRLGNGRTITDTSTYFDSLRRDIAAGPNGVRARTGALQADLEALRAFLIRKEVAWINR